MISKSDKIQTSFAPSALLCRCIFCSSTSKAQHNKTHTHRTDDYSLLQSLLCQGFSPAAGAKWLSYSHSFHTDKSNMMMTMTTTTDSNVWANN